MLGGRARAGHGPEAGNRLIILPESRRREPNALMVETMKPEKEGGGGRACATSAKLIYHVAKKQERASLHSSSHFSLKRERRGGGIRVIEARNLTTAGGRKDRRREGGSRVRLHRLHHHPVSVALSVARKLLSKEKRGTREASLAHTRVVPRQRDWKEARERWSCEIFARTKANRSILRSAFLFESGHISFQ